MSRLAVFLVCLAAVAGAEPVPPDLQAELTAKLVKYDRNFAARAGPETTVLIAYRPATSGSERMAQLMKNAFAAQPSLGGVKHSAEVVTYTSADQLLAVAREKKAGLVVAAPGVTDDAAAIARAFDGYPGLTLSSTGEGVDQGLTLGFELVSGKPRMMVHLEQARKQNADFRAEVLKLMKVYP